SQGHLQGPAHLESVPVEGDGASQDGDDREAEGEVGESAHVAQELLCVAELAQLFGIPVERRVGHRVVLSRFSSPASWTRARPKGPGIQSTGHLPVLLPYLRERSGLRAIRAVSTVSPADFPKGGFMKAIVFHGVGDVRLED